jgi:tetrapyrrole methylase family protein / MazG family protein
MPLHPSQPEFQALSPFDQLVEIMAALRAPDGCPWDLEQTHQTLTAYLLEETYETLEAIESGVDAKMCEELGDLMLQVVFHAQLARERGVFDIQEVCRTIVEKLVRRHPHVFARGPKLDGSAEVLQQWEEIKKTEKGAKAGGSVLDGVGQGFPALPQAALLQERASRAGFAYADQAGAWDKLQEELSEFQAQPSEEELGDVLFALVSVARQHGIDPEAALRQTNRKFRERFRSLEERFPEGLRTQPPDQLVAAWREAAGQRQG